MDEPEDNTSIVPATPTGLVKVSSIIKITNKIIFNEIEELFNEAFYLLIKDQREFKTKENYCY